MHMEKPALALDWYFQGIMIQLFFFNFSQQRFIILLLLLYLSHSIFQYKLFFVM